MIVLMILVVVAVAVMVEVYEGMVMIIERQKLLVIFMELVTVMKIRNMKAMQKKKEKKKMK